MWIQVRSEDDFRDRTLFYWAKLYTSELKKGEIYGNLKKTITINIVNFNLFESFFIQRSNEKIYVIIDEYDHFANELLGLNPESFKKLSSASQKNSENSGKLSEQVKKYTY